MATIEKSLDKLKYLESCIDFEGGSDQGRLIDKEILIYSPAKTATVTLFHGIGVHLANRYGWSNYVSKMLHNHNNRLLAHHIRTEDPDITLQGLANKTIIKDLIQYRASKGQRTLIVTSYRDPLARLISNTFQALDGQVRKGSIDLNQATLGDCLELMKPLMKNMLDGELHPIEEVDPDFFEKHRFNHQEKCCYVSTENYELMVLNMHHSDAWANAFTKYLGFRNLAFESRNQASDKPLSRHYKEFKDDLRINKQLIKDLYYESPESRYARWFFTQTEISSFCETATEHYGADFDTEPRLRLATSPNAPPKIPTDMILAMDSKEKTAAKIEVSELEQLSQNSFRMVARITNTGQTVWMPDLNGAGRMAVALRGRNSDDQLKASNRCVLRDNLTPTESTTIDHVFNVPEGVPVSALRPEVICVGVFWLKNIQSTPLVPEEKAGNTP